MKFTHPGQRPKIPSLSYYSLLVTNGFSLSTDAPFRPPSLGLGASVPRLMVLVRPTRVFVVSALVQKCHQAHRSHVLLTYLNLCLLEQIKAVPVLSSSLYGHRPPLEKPSRRHVRVATVKRDFYRHSGTNIPLF